VIPKRFRNLQDSNPKKDAAAIANARSINNKQFAININLTLLDTSLVPKK